MVGTKMSVTGICSGQQYRRNIRADINFKYRKQAASLRFDTSAAPEVGKGRPVGID